MYNLLSSARLDRAGSMEQQLRQEADRIAAAAGVGDLNGWL